MASIITIVKLPVFKNMHFLRKASARYIMNTKKITKVEKVKANYGMFGGKAGYSASEIESIGKLMS